MSQGLVRLAVWGTIAITIVNLLAIAAALVALLLGRLPPTLSLVVDVSTLFDAFTAMMTAIVAALIIASRPRNALGWIILGTALALGLSGLTTVYTTLGLYTPWLHLPGLGWTAVAYQSLWPLPLLGVSLLVLLFPTGSFLTPRWRGVAAFSIVAFLSVMLVSIVMTPLEIGGLTNPNPVGLVTTAQISPYIPFIFGLIAIALGGALVGMLVRYRRSVGVERQQMKWLLYVSALFVLAENLNFLAPAVSLPGLVSLVALGFPIAFGIAILRYRLFDIDLIIRKTATYAVLTASLLLIYFGSVVMLERVLALLTGSSQNEVITVVSTLAIAALFVPLRARIQAWIDRRFYRKKYDAEQVLHEFGETMRDETDLERLTARLVGVMQETMQPRSVSVWLRRQVNK
jgi:hypothetical protein